MTVTLKVTGGRGDKVAQFYNCGKPGDEFYDEAQGLREEGDTEAVRDFINTNFEEPDVETFTHQLDDGNISVVVEDDCEEAVFEDEAFSNVTSSFVHADPRTWEFDASMGEGLISRIKAFIASKDAEIEAAVAKWKADNPGKDFDDSFGDDYLEDIGAGVCSLIVQAPFVEAGLDLNNYYLPSGKESPALLFATMCADLYGTGCMACDIELDDDEDFDPDKLSILLSDYDGFYYSCDDAALPVVLYGNKFYRLRRDAWEAHYQYYGFAAKEEGGSYFEFEGSDF